MVLIDPLVPRWGCKIYRYIYMCICNRTYEGGMFSWPIDSSSSWMELWWSCSYMLHPTRRWKNIHIFHMRLIDMDSCVFFIFVHVRPARTILWYTSYTILRNTLVSTCVMDWYGHENAGPRQRPRGGAYTILGETFSTSTMKQYLRGHRRGCMYPESGSNHHTIVHKSCVFVRVHVHTYPVVTRTWNSTKQLVGIVIETLSQWRDVEEEGSICAEAANRIHLWIYRSLHTDSNERTPSHGRT
jgi:hypothetical protein